MKHVCRPSKASASGCFQRYEQAKPSAYKQLKGFPAQAQHTAVNCLTRNAGTRSHETFRKRAGRTRAWSGRRAAAAAARGRGAGRCCAAASAPLAPPCEPPQLSLGPPPSAAQSSGWRAGPPSPAHTQLLKVATAHCTICTAASTCPHHAKPVCGMLHASRCRTGFMHAACLVDRVTATKALGTVHLIWGHISLAQHGMHTSTAALSVKPGESLRTSRRAARNMPFKATTAAGARAA